MDKQEYMQMMGYGPESEQVFDRRVSLMNKAIENAKKKGGKTSGFRKMKKKQLDVEVKLQFNSNLWIKRRFDTACGR